MHTGAVTDADETVRLLAKKLRHDLLQPVTALLANAELLTMEPAVAGDPEALKLAEATFAAGRRLATLIESLSEPPYN